MIGIINRPEFGSTDYKKDMDDVGNHIYTAHPISRLVYNIETGVLSGNITTTNIEIISISAGSGGRAGSTTKGAVNPLLANNSLATHIGGESSKGTHMYGPVPQGTYSLQMHETRKNWIRLIPAKNTETPGRNKLSFAIHGRGKIGSHGCIVPMEKSDLLYLCELVQNNKKRGCTPITLEVIAKGTNIGWQMRTA